MRNGNVLLLLTASALWAQSGWTEFSIGPATASHSQFSRFGIRAEGVPLLRAIARAYGVPEHRVAGPPWLPTERYAITAQVSDPLQFQPLFQQELANRFHMLAHREQRDIPVFVLKPVEGAQKLTPAAPPGSASMAGGGLQMSGATMAGFAAALADSIRRPVIDETGIDGAFDFKLSWQGGNMASLQAAARQQLGLQLIDDKRVVELLIIDHIEKLEFPK
jgi:uncharacterized protein (TIGR03435 family)